MYNAEFKRSSDDYREDRLVHIIYRKTEGKLPKSIITAMLKSVDLSKQIEILVVKKEDLDKYSYIEQRINCNHKGNMLSLRTDYCKCIYGSMKFGKSIVISREKVIEYLAVEKPIYNYFPIVIFQNQEEFYVSDNKLKSSFTNVIIICLDNRS